MVIPASVTKIGKRAFAHNYGVLSVTFDDTEGWYNCAGSYPWAEIESKEIDVSDSSKNVLELTSQDPYTWGNLGIYKKTN